MTFGYGFWRSGYNMIYTYIWRYSKKDHLAYASSGGNFLDDNGNVIMTTYWENFREGINDAKYIYTLQNAIIQREGSRDKRLNKLLEDGKCLLQNIWDSINEQTKYLDTGIWAADEFEARRWQMADMIKKLYSFPANNKSIAPSVIVDTNAQRDKTVAGFTDELTSDKNSGFKKRIQLSKNDFEQWKYNSEDVVSTIRKTNGVVTIKMKMDTSNGVGWPQLSLNFKNKGLDISKYDFFSVYLKVNSNRDEAADDTTPIALICKSNNNIQSSKYFTKITEEGKWVHKLLPMDDILGSLPLTAQKEIICVKLCTSESFYPKGTDLVLEFKDPEFIMFTKAIISETEIPTIAFSGSGNLKYKIKVFGISTKKKTQVHAELIDESGKIQASMKDEVLSSGLMMFNFPFYKIPSGNYTFKVSLLNIKNRKSLITSEYKQRITLIESPFARNTPFHTRSNQ